MDVLTIIKQISGKNNIDGLQQNKKQEWLSWYVGKVKKFHRYTIYNGKKRVPMERMSLGMAKKACEDWANLLANEKTDIVLGTQSEQEVLNKYLGINKFWKKLNGAVEKYMALGIGAIVEGVNNFSVNEDGDVLSDGTPNIQLINGTKVYPLAFENDRITECAFVNENPDCVILTIHLLAKDGTYEIHNLKCKGSIAKANLQYNPEDYTIFRTNSRTPWFQILKPGIENNVDINSPLGISVFANSIDILKSMDLTYDGLYNEVNLGRKRIFIATRYLKTNPVTGETMDVFDANDVEYYALPESDDGKNIITDNTQQLRIDQLSMAIQRQLDLYSTSVGFGQTHFKYDGGNLTTATQVISENSDQYRTLKKHEIVLEEVLIDMTKALIEIINTYTSDNISPDTNIEIQFDDSIIEDKESEKASDRIDLEKGIISRAEYRAKYYSEDLQTAEKRIKEIARENNTQIMSDITMMRNDISQETALELNPYIEDVQAELAKIQKESESNISLLDDMSFSNQINEINKKDEEVINQTQNNAQMG